MPFVLLILDKPSELSIRGNGDTAYDRRELANKALKHAKQEKVGEIAQDSDWTSIVELLMTLDVGRDFRGSFISCRIWSRIV